MDEKSLCENAQAVQAGINEISKALSFIVEVIDCGESIDIETHLKPQFIAAMIEEVITIVDNEAGEVFAYFGIKDPESKNETGCPKGGILIGNSHPDSPGHNNSSR